MKARTKNTQKTRLVLDKELIADLDVDSSEIRGGMSGSGTSYTGGSGGTSVSLSNAATRRGGPAIAGGGGNEIGGC